MAQWRAAELAFSHMTDVADCDWRKWHKLRKDKADSSRAQSTTRNIYNNSRDLQEYRKTFEYQLAGLASATKQGACKANANPNADQMTDAGGSVERR